MDYFYRILSTILFLYYLGIVVKTQKYIIYNTDQKVALSDTYSNVVCPNISPKEAITKVDKSLLKTTMCNGSYWLLAFSSVDRFNFVSVQTNKQSKDTLISNITSTIKSHSIYKNHLLFFIDYNDAYSTFILCVSTEICSGTIIDMNALYDLALYSPCQNVNTGPVHPEYQFFNNTVVFACVSYTASLPSTELEKASFCMNRGTLDPNYQGPGIKCLCKSIPGISFGARCETKELDVRRISSVPHLLGKYPTVFTLKFRFYSSNAGDEKPNIIFSIIDKSKQMQLNYTNYALKQILAMSGHDVITFDSKLDSQKWMDFYLEINSDSIKLIANGFQKIVKKPSEYWSFPLDLQNARFKFDQSLYNRFCITDALINDQMIDLDPEAKNLCCKSDCSACKGVCLCKPFVSGTATCLNPYLNNASIEISPDKSYKIPIKQVFVTETTPITLPFNLEFQFRTRLLDGNIISISSNTLEISVSLDKGKLKLTYSENNKAISSSTMNFYLVNDGQLHTALLNIFNNSLDALRTATLKFEEQLLGNEIYVHHNMANIISYLSFGPLAVDNKHNYSMCFSKISSLMEQKVVPANISTNGVSQGCTSFFNCTEKCPMNSQCTFDWQFAQCSCIPNYSAISNGTCMPDACINSISNDSYCLNGALCTITNITSTNNASAANSTGFVCICPAGFTGKHCSDPIIVAGGLWWIAVLIVLLLLLILIILLICCLCCRKRRQNEPKHDIAQINENAVKYNEQAGEEDYKGPPIDFYLINNALKNGNIPSKYGDRDLPDKVPSKIFKDLNDMKLDQDHSNPDLILDQPLDYGYEGNDPNQMPRQRNSSISSLGSSSTDSRLNIDPLEGSPSRQFQQLNQIFDQTSRRK